ncbi:MAG: M20/M25/M40 family metallo-hydrolase [Proteobacteria bacterium]|nr:M20/M25/M40 family metallo-hydrolase [Pseudomonadota bacterium]
MNKLVPIAVASGLAVILAGPASASGRRNEAVFHAAETNRAGALDLLKTIVDIDSGSGDVTGGERVEHELAPRLEAIGARLEYHPAEARGLAPNLVAVLRGKGTARILIIAHIDTVFGPGTVAKRGFSVAGDRAHGPGVGDEKGGGVNAVTALKILHDLRFDKFATITLLLDSSEELGSPGSTELIKSLARQSDVEFNMEPGDPPDAVTVWRKGSGDIRIHVQGRAAHAGMAPEAGRNAAVELVNQLNRIQAELPHSGSGTTVNLTVLKADGRTNIIPDSAEAILDVRVRKLEDFATVLHQIQGWAAHTATPDTVVTAAADGATYPPLIEGPDVHALGLQAQRIYAELGKNLALSGNGGASESAVVNSVGVPALDGLGYVGGDFHTDHEWIDLASVTPRLYLFTRLLMETSGANPRRAADVGHFN